MNVKCTRALIIGKALGFRSGYGLLLLRRSGLSLSTMFSSRTVREGRAFMAKNVAQFMLERLSEWGVKRIYGYPGDGINALLGAFHEVGDQVEFLQTSHEELAAFAACADAKLTGEV